MDIFSKGVCTVYIVESLPYANPNMADYVRDNASFYALHKCRRTANSAMTENDLLDLKSTGGSFVIILTSETLLVIKDDCESELTWISNFAWRKFASTRPSTVMQPFWTNGPESET